MFTLKLALAIVVLLAVILRALRVFLSKTATSSTPYTTTVVAYLVITDLTVRFSLTVSPFTCKLNPRKQHYIKKELYLYTSQKSAQLYVALANKDDLRAKDLLIIEIRVGEPLDPSLSHLQDSRDGGIWVRRSKFFSKIGQAIIEVNILFSINAVNPRP